MEGREGPAEGRATVPSTGEGGQEVHGRPRPHDALVVLRARLQVLRRDVGGRCDPGHVERREEIVAAVEHAHVGTVELVGGAGEEVAAEGAHVDERVRRVVDRVHEDEGSALAGEGGEVLLRR